MKDGMGWLGWSYDQTLDTPMPVIELAMAGLYEKLKAIHGASDAPPAAVEPPPPEAIRSVFRAAAGRRTAPSK